MHIIPLPLANIWNPFIELSKNIIKRYDRLEQYKPVFTDMSQKNASPIKRPSVYAELIDKNTLISRL